MYHLSESGRAELNPAPSLTVKRWKGNEEWLKGVRRKYGNTSSFVYLIHNFQNGLSKIGYSIRPDIRERTLASMEPLISTIAVCITPDIEVAERDIHYIFQEDRVRGEWFTLNGSQIEICVQCFADYGTAEVDKPSLDLAVSRFRGPEYYI